MEDFYSDSLYFFTTHQFQSGQQKPQNGLQFIQSQMNQPHGRQNQFNASAPSNVFGENTGEPFKFLKTLKNTVFLQKKSNNFFNHFLQLMLTMLQTLSTNKKPIFKLK